MPTSVPAYTFGGITRPALTFDSAGHIILDAAAAQFEAAYGTKALYAGLPANTPYPAVAAPHSTLSTPVDANAGINSVLENAATNSTINLTVQATNAGGPPVTYSLTDDAGGRFQINAVTGVVTVADGSLLDYETAPNLAYDVTAQATDGILTTSQTFTIGVGNVNEAPAGSDGTVTANQNAAYVFSTADFGFSDPSDSISPNALAAVRIAALPAAGTLLNNGVPVAAGDSISAADIDAGHLVFLPTENGSGDGYASFTFQVRDTGGTANGGVDTDASPNTITIDVTAVNDAPPAVAASIQSLAINNDTAAQASLLPIVRGTAGNDIIDAGFGGKILVGEAGADQFVFADVPTSTPLTHVADYSFIQGDSFDFSALTSAFHGSGISDDQIVRAVEDASGSFATLQVNTYNGAMGSKSGPNWVDVAQIDGARAGDDVSVLIESHAVHLAQIHVGLLA
ncbi:MAG: uncharacterized protein JWR80_3460 [Bradyrhizobium sp.]|nr:uncharacterized protein [Bradyrhizobium sp.]